MTKYNDNFLHTKGNILKSGGDGEAWKELKQMDNTFFTPVSSELGNWMIDIDLYAGLYMYVAIKH